MKTKQFLIVALICFLLSCFLAWKCLAGDKEELVLKIENNILKMQTLQRDIFVSEFIRLAQENEGYKQRLQTIEKPEADKRAKEEKK